MLFGYAAIAVISKFWEDHDYIMACDYCYYAKVDFTDDKKFYQVCRQFFDAEMKLCESIEFQLEKLSIKVWNLRNAVRDANSHTAM